MYRLTRIDRVTLQNVHVLQLMEMYVRCDAVVEGEYNKRRALIYTLQKWLNDGITVRCVMLYEHRLEMRI